LAGFLLKRKALLKIAGLTITGIALGE